MGTSTNESRDHESTERLDQALRQIARLLARSAVRELIQGDLGPEQGVPTDASASSCKPLNT